MRNLTWMDREEEGKEEGEEEEEEDINQGKRKRRMFSKIGEDKWTTKRANLK